MRDCPFPNRLRIIRRRDWDLLYDVLVKGQFLVTQAGVEVMRKQAIGGDVLNIVSKNALVSGPNNAGYGSAKAAQLHLSRLNAAELGADHIRVNVVNPDAVIADSKIWEGAWAEGRAKAYGVAVSRPACLLRQANPAERDHSAGGYCQCLFCLCRGIAEQVDRECAECRWRSGDGVCTLNILNYAKGCFYHAAA